MTVGEEPGPTPAAPTPRRRSSVEDIVAATTRLTAEREFDELAVLDICIEADISVSSFYHRFPSKDDLLVEVHRRYLDDVRTSLWARVESVDWETPDHEALVRGVISEYLQLRVDFAPRFRTMALAEARHPRLATSREAADAEAVDGFVQLFAARFPDGRRDEIVAATAFATRVVVLVAQDLTAMGRVFHVREPSDLDLLTDRLVGMVVSSLRPLLDRH